MLIRTPPRLPDHTLVCYARHSKQAQCVPLLIDCFRTNYRSMEVTFPTHYIIHWFNWLAGLHTKSIWHAFQNNPCHKLYSAPKKTLKFFKLTIFKVFKNIFYRQYELYCAPLKAIRSFTQNSNNPMQSNKSYHLLL